MYHYPVVEEYGYCASVSAKKVPAGRWRAWVVLERDRDFARLKVQSSTPVGVPNSYPSEEMAVQAAYAHAHMLISREVDRAAAH